MTLQRVIVMRTKDDEKPRAVIFDDTPNKDGSPSLGSSMIETIQRRVRREELYSATVEQVVFDPPAEMVAAAAKAAPKKATAEA